MVVVFFEGGLAPQLPGEASFQQVNQSVNKCDDVIPPALVVVEKGVATCKHQIPIERRHFPEFYMLSFFVYEQFRYSKVDQMELPAGFTCEI